MGFLDWMNKSTSKGTPIQTGVENSIHDSLVEISFVVSAMGKSDPNHPNWHKYIGDFDKAVKGVQTALKAYERERKHRGLSVER
jgi:hypothetical protein